MANRITWDDRALINTLRTLPMRADRALNTIMVYHAGRAVAYAKRNATWTDQTGNARNGLFSRAERDRPKYRIILGHSVPYGVWLEVRFSGRYGIIRPTIDIEGREVMRSVGGLFGRIFGG